MAGHVDETEISGMKEAQIPSPQSNGQNGNTTTRQSILRKELPMNGSHDMSTQAQAPGTEARDYMNGGIPHELTGTSTPPGRRSVQFARATDGALDSPNHQRQNSFEDDTDANKKRDSQSIISKLKALTAPAHGRSQSATSFSFGGSPEASSTPQTPTSRTPRRTHDILEEEGSDADADVEDQTADEDGEMVNAIRKRRKKKIYRGSSSDMASPSSPMATSPFSIPRILRRSTLPEDDERVGMSEGEGRDHIQRQSAWRRGSAHLLGSTRGSSSTALQHETMEGNNTAPSRPSNFRRVTGTLGGGVSDGEATRTTRPRAPGNRATTLTAAKWRQVKQSMKMIVGTRKNVKLEIDYQKSAELMAELRAGAPAALMLASMIQRDEHGNKRIPILLEQLKIRISDSDTTDVNKDKDKDSERHMIFRIELEYGSGVGRMKWVIYRSLTDFFALHSKYKLQTNSDKYLQLNSDVRNRPKQPKFPKSAVPYARGLRGLKGAIDSDNDEGETNAQAAPASQALPTSPPLNSPPINPAEETAAEATHSEADRPKSKRQKSRPGLGGLRRRSTALGESGEAAKKFAASQRESLEKYLQEMIRWLIFRPDSNRLCKFLELSALGVRLSAEGGYHGKEGYLVIQTSKGVDFRKLLTPGAIFARHSPKWFLVRSNYIVCVDSPENMHIYDVFLLDSRFEIDGKRRNVDDINPDDAALALSSKSRHPQHHRLKLRNSERKLKLLARNERMVMQFEASIQQMIRDSPWSKKNRFDSFAPVRQNVFAQWLVDGRDYMWNVSRAINEAKDVIYIHDWWLSPQLYMRRPAAISQKWRLDRLLRKKAREGVKVFVIVYRNVEAAIPIDSEFTKFCLLDLHPNIFVQRSPNQFKKNQFFYAHHEKICIVDHSVAFVGGIDLCFGRWDTPQHSVTDDKQTGFEPSDQPKTAENCQLWPGKDYSNPRVQDFYKLNEPYAEMYDRSKTPRMPWHDISMQVVGQPARDLTRHFVQRWNYVLRGRKPTRPTPFLLPPPDYLPKDLEDVGMTGTCEVQILRSASNWSLGIEHVEHSIMNAYCKMIEESEHFVYIENQFFITSCETMNTKIVNKIGDAIVERAIRAYKEDQAWRCIIIIPLMPGFQNTVDQADGSSVRLIMQCQFRSISRGDGSIFSRLRREGIEPEDFVTFYSLRAWGKIGPNKNLVTEQLYIHAKVIIVDDRIALIGSANINERSMLGSRDSETAAVVRDTDQIWSTMDGKPYLVGRFAHTLRMRLMREHLGLDVDAIMEEERSAELDREVDFEGEMNQMYDEPEKVDESRAKRQEMLRAESVFKAEGMHSFNHDFEMTQKDNPNLAATRIGMTSDKRATNNKEHEKEVDGEGEDQWKAAEKSGLVRGRDSILVDGVREVLVTDISPEGKGTLQSPKKPHPRVSIPKSPKETDSTPSNESIPPMPQFPRRTTEQLGLIQLSQLPALPVIDDTDIGGPPITTASSGKVMDASHPLMSDLKRANVSKDCMKDPLNDAFFDDTWRTVAETNTKIFRRVFRCNPDNEVTNWAEYVEYAAYAERFAQAQQGGKSSERENQESKGKSGPVGSGLIPTNGVGQHLNHLSEKIHHRDEDTSHPSGTVAEWAEKANREAAAKNGNGSPRSDHHASVMDEKEALKQEQHNEALSPVLPAGDQAFPPLDRSSDTMTSEKPSSRGTTGTTLNNNEKPTERRTTFSTTTIKSPTDTNNTESPNITHANSQRRRRRATTARSSKHGFRASDDVISKVDAEALLGMVQGSLVVFPYDWLKVEEHNSNWLYQVDQVAPLQI